MELSRAAAQQADRDDPFASYRDQFVISDPDLIYLDGNSLGRLPRRSAERLRQLTEQEWGQELIRGWNQGWYEAPGRIGDKIGRLVGAAPEQIVACDSTSVNLYKLASAALGLRPGRRKVISDTLNFPSDLYVLQGVIQAFGGQHQLQLIPADAAGIAPDVEALAAAIDDDTALVVLSHVAFKSGYLYDMAAITARAHAVGALVLWDLCHSVGALPIELDAAEVDFAIGCTYKYLNGGPGAPAFLYVRQALQAVAVSPIWGWFGQQSPFAFGLDYQPAEGISRFLAGTPPILSLLAIEPALDLMLEIGLEALRQKSLQLSAFLIALSDARLSPLGFTLGSPREAAQRGSHVSLRHPQGYQINRALIEELKVLPDFREPDNLRLGLTPLSTTFTEVWEAVERIERAVREGIYLRYSAQRAQVT